MDYFDHIEGNDGAKSLLRSQAQAGTLSHAYIIEGVPGSGRKSLAIAALCTLAGGDDADRIARGVCPDIHYIRPPEDKTTIVVDQIRELREQAWLRPSELDFRAFIIDGAHRMNEPAQNALLKLLEEPPAGVYFFLTCDLGCRLLPTVLSRAQLLRTQILPPEAIDTIVKGLSARAAMTERTKPEEYARIIASSASVGQALELLEGSRKLTADFHPMVTTLLDVLRSSNKAELIDFVSDVPDDREGYSAFLGALAFALRDLIAVKKGWGNMLFLTGDEADEYIFAFSEGDCARRLALVIKAMEQNESFVNLKLAKAELFDGLWG